MTARCPVCHRRQRVVAYRWGFRFAEHPTGSRSCRNSGEEVPR